MHIQELIIFQNTDYALRYVGPDIASVDRIVITFPDLAHPTGFDVRGWAEVFLAKRNVAQISVLVKDLNWYQSDGFMEAMDAAKDFTGGRKITTYGSSMGGYGAILGAKRLGADRVVAFCPQFSIEPDIVPFERRYREQAAVIGTFIHNINAELDDSVTYIIGLDPSHARDRKQEALFAKPAKWQRLPVYGAGHGVLQLLLDMDAKQGLLDLLVGKTGPDDLRQDIRNARATSYRYIRRMGNLAQGRDYVRFYDYAKLAESLRYYRLARKWRKAR